MSQSRKFPLAPTRLAIQLSSPVRMSEILILILPEGLTA